jgi:NifU-like protein involved in Fe-S cluster formation
MDYGTEVRQRFSVLASAGTLAADAGTVVAGAAEDRSLGFWVRFQVELRGDGIERVRFQAFGCPAGLAAADLVAEALKGQPVAALANLNVDDIARRLEMPREKLGKLLRIEDALAACHRMAISKEQG